MEKYRKEVYKMAKKVKKKGSPNPSQEKVELTDKDLEVMRIAAATFIGWYCFKMFKKLR
jgi:uncharacterized protein YpbB